VFSDGKAKWSGEELCGAMAMQSNVMQGDVMQWFSMVEQRMEALRLCEVKFSDVTARSGMVLISCG